MRSDDWHVMLTPETTTEDEPHHNPDTHGYLQGHTYSCPSCCPQNTDQDQTMQVASVEEASHQGTLRQPPGCQQETQKGRRSYLGSTGGHNDTQHS